MTTEDDANNRGSAAQMTVLSPGTGAGMGVGVGAALTAATGDGWWIGAFAGLGAVVAMTLTALGNRKSRSAK